MPTRKSSFRIRSGSVIGGQETTFVEDVRNRVRLPVQIATDNHRPYAFHIRQHFRYEGYSYGTETKVFGEPKLPDGTLARLGRNEGVRKMQTAERTAVIGSPDLESLTTSHVERAFLTVRQELKRFQRKGLGYSKELGNAQAGRVAPFRRLQLCPPASQPWNHASGSCWPRRKAVEFRKSRGNDRGVLAYEKAIPKLTRIRQHRRMNSVLKFIPSIAALICVAGAFMDGLHRQQSRSA